MMKTLSISLALVFVASCSLLGGPAGGTTGTSVIDQQQGIVAIDDFGVQLKLCDGCNLVQANKVLYHLKRDNAIFASIELHDNATEGGAEGWIKKWSPGMTAFKRIDAQDADNSFSVYYSKYRKRPFRKVMGYYFEGQYGDKTIACIMSKGSVAKHEIVKDVCSSIELAATPTK